MSVAYRALSGTAAPTGYQALNTCTRAASNWDQFMLASTAPVLPSIDPPNEMLKNVRNLADFARVIVLDKWTSNSDGRQAVFCRKSGRSRYKATFIDQGYCFSASEWTFLDYPLRGVYSSNCVYEGVRGWDAFEPALTRAESMDRESIWECAADIPESSWAPERRSAQSRSTRRRGL